MFRLYYFIFPVFMFSQIHAQNELNVWCFGADGLNFNSGQPFHFSGMSMYASESSSGICDENGQLLFYTNGGSSPTYTSIVGGVWNRNHELMPNGLLGNNAGCFSTVQGVIVVPDPSNFGVKSTSDKYYILTVDCIESMVVSGSAENKGLRYTKVDMGLDAGLGDVVELGVPVVTMAIVYPLTTSKEALTAISHENGRDCWVIFAQNDSTGVLLLDETGFSEPVYYPIMPKQFSPSPKGNKLMIQHELFDFNSATGEISNPITIGVEGNYYHSFSPDGNRLYLVKPSGVIQYDVTSSSILSTAVTITNTPNCRAKLGPDKRIYLMNDAGIKARIDCPNNLGLSCNFNSSVHVDFTNPSRTGFPNFYQTPMYHETDACFVGIGEQLDEKTFLSFPNPCDDVCNLELPFEEQITIVLVDMSGKQLFSVQAQKTIVFSTENLENGVYFLATSDKSLKPLKVVVQH